jgi:UrcA family protein
MNNRQKIATFFLAATMASGAMANSLEMDSYGNQAVAIKYADLNIENSAGAKVLYQRIERAAERVCRVNSGVVSITQARAQKNCVVGTIDAAVERVGSVEVKRIHRS